MDRKPVETSLMIDKSHEIICIDKSLLYLKSVFSEIRVWTWIEVISAKKNKPLIGRPDSRSANHGSVFFGMETT